MSKKEDKTIVEVMNLGKPFCLTMDDLENTLKKIVGDMTGIVRITNKNETYYVVAPHRPEKRTADGRWVISYDNEDVYEDGVQIDFAGSKIFEVDDDCDDACWEVDDEASVTDFLEHLKDLMCYSYHTSPCSTTMRILKFLIELAEADTKIDGLEIQNIEPFKEVKIDDD